MFIADRLEGLVDIEKLEAYEESLDRLQALILIDLLDRNNQLGVVTRWESEFKEEVQCFLDICEELGKEPIVIVSYPLNEEDYTYKFEKQNGTWKYVEA